MYTCSIENIVAYIVELYNRFHGAEARARVVEISNNTVKIEFSGSFCHTCGVRDWVEDFAYLAISEGYNARLLAYIDPDEDVDEYKRFGVFEITCNSKNN
ncbi:MAG: hypothetical protein QXE81_02950 [Desulfurococcaceae archaeon]